MLLCIALCDVLLYLAVTCILLAFAKLFFMYAAASAEFMGDFKDSAILRNFLSTDSL